jgi:CheY-like chemotaxis protein
MSKLLIGGVNVEGVVRRTLTDVLREEGFQVIEVSDAAEAISILKAMPVDVVITDLRMSAVAHRSAAACACLREPSLLLVTLSPSTFLHPPLHRLSTASLSGS